MHEIFPFGATFPTVSDLFGRSPPFEHGGGDSNSRKMRVPPPSPGQKAYLLALGRGEQSEHSDLEDDGDNMGTIERERAKVLPEELRKRFDSCQAGGKAVHEYCFSKNKSCVQHDRTRGSTYAVFVCPFRFRTDTVKGKPARKQALDAELHGTEEEHEETERLCTEGDQETSEEAKIICPFCLVLRKRMAGEHIIWELEEEGCEPDHDGERCPSKHSTPPWVLDSHPVFLAEMMKLKSELRTMSQEDRTCACIGGGWDNQIECHSETA
jgi:hypothetical protein